MKTGLEMYFQQLAGNPAAHDEIGLGIDAMLGHEVVKFLAMNHKNCKPLGHRRGAFKQNAIRHALDEHELAML